MPAPPLHLRRTLTHALLGLSILLCATSIHAADTAASDTIPPGVVITHSPQASGRYIGSPSLTVLPNGDYLASHDFFGPQSNEWECPTVQVFRSSDRGDTWTRVATLECLFWAGLFTHRDAAYLMGTDKHHGRIVIRRSTDGGETWTEPRDETTGRLTPDGQFHTAPMPVIEHAGRLWRAFEDAAGGDRWGERYSAGMLSIPVDADPLHATHWIFSNFLPRDPDWLNGGFNAWLEGNAVVDPDGNLLNILRVDTPGLPEKAAIVRISADGRTASFDPATGFIDFPGGAKKFTIRKDPSADCYWTLASIIPDHVTDSDKPSRVRNTLALMRSTDLREWERRAVLLHHPDVANHGFQYADWRFDGDDLIAVVRTAHDDGEGGARNNHDANFLTFHRWQDFRSLTTAALELHNDGNGRLHMSRPPVPELARHLKRMEILDELLREPTWFTEGSTNATFRNAGSLGEGWLQRYGIDAVVHEFNCNWIAGFEEPPSARHWQDYGAKLATVFHEYFDRVRL